MSLWGDYFAEREGYSYIENHLGFLLYKIHGDECYIRDLYVKPEFRRMGHGAWFGEEVAKIAKEKGCKYLSSTIVPSTNGSSSSLKSQLNEGFRLVHASNDLIILRKDL